MTVPHKMTVKALRQMLDEFNKDDIVYLYCNAAPFRAIAELGVYDEGTLDCTLLMANEDNLKKE